MLTAREAHPYLWFFVTPPTVPADGAVIGRFRLLNRLGAGGMGEVWRAQDQQLDRIVALKLLAPAVVTDTDSRERFRREALALSRLSHPGVATLYDFDSLDGRDVLVMEYVAGGTLEARIANGPLAIDDVLRIGIAVADALHDAHQRGVLHRDIKPGNVALTEGGHPKLLDFGIAALSNATDAMSKLTKAGMMVGSLPYMSPEQLTGDADGVSTDVYALGVLLFELAAGRRPFVKERPEALMFEIFGSAAPALRSLRTDVPAALEQLVADCLAKEPALRPASAAVIRDALRAMNANGASQAITSRSEAAPARPKVRAIAVLPLRNVSGDAAQEYFADGMTEALIGELARIKALKVISRTSVMAYKGSTKSLPDVARELNVDAVLEGSALLLGDRVRISVQLVTAAADETLWAERYDRKLEDVLGLQADVAETVAREVAVQLTPQEATHLARRTPVNPEAHLEYLKSRHAFVIGTKDAIATAMAHAQRAIELDPTFAAAWSSLADCHVLRAARGMASPAEAAAAATEAARHALALDPELADAHVSLALIQSHTSDLHGALASFTRAIALNPNLALAHNRMCAPLYALERHAEAQAAALKSVQLDPLSGLLRTAVGDTYYYAREYEKSVFHYRMAIELEPRFDGAHTDLARTLEALGRFDEARASYEEGRRLSGGVAGPTFGLAHLEAAAGNVREARRILGELTAARAQRVVSAWGIAALHAALGDVDDAFHWLEIAITERASGMMLLRVHPRLDPIRRDPRYWPLVTRVGLADAGS